MYPRESEALAPTGTTLAPTGTTLGPDHFEDLYATHEDPWHIETSWYEQRKHRLTMAALPRKRYHRVAEPGCANGALTALLAERCDEVFAFDFVEQAVDAAQARIGDADHVHVINARFPDYWPYGTGDLVVWSEVANYLSDVGWDAATVGLDHWLEPGGHVVAVHSTGDSQGPVDQPRSGACIARRLDQLEFLERLVGLVDQHFELGVWVRRPRELMFGANESLGSVESGNRAGDRRFQTPDRVVDATCSDGTAQSVDQPPSTCRRHEGDA